MSRAMITLTHLDDIADAIREKLEVETTYRPSQMADAILSITALGAFATTEQVLEYLGIPAGYAYGGAVIGTKSITANGSYSASSDAYDGYSSVTVNVPAWLDFSASAIEVTT